LFSVPSMFCCSNQLTGNPSFSVLSSSEVEDFALCKVTHF
jgi:hypothetical protein